MPRLTILSPHRDDAVFSLYIALSKWAKRSVEIRVLNFFTISDYAPWAFSSRKMSVSALRQHEDHRAFAMANPSARVLSLNWLDAPLRLNIGAAAIANPETPALRPAGEAHSFILKMRAHWKNGLVLAPLALGNHVDHLAIREAAIGTGAEARLAFYEDLPYATWTAEDAILNRVAETEKLTHAPLKPVVVRSPNGRVAKFQAVRQYNSQITRNEAVAISRYALKYRTGERIWVPKRSQRWRSLANMAYVEKL